MYLHGSTHDLSVGEILVPGVESGFNSNGGKSESVYIVSTDGFSLSECENSEGYDNAFDFAVSEALWWGDSSFIYVVEPLGELMYDDNHDVSPACAKTSTARIVGKYDFTNYSFKSLCQTLRNFETLERSHRNEQKKNY